jgi:hypothetical protein
MAGRLEFRKSQGVVPFGVGAIIDFPNESLMMAGLDAWPSEQVEAAARSQIENASRVLDGRLARRLSINLERKIDYFLSPIEAPDNYGFAPTADGKGMMPFVRFPNWHFCPRCRVLKHVAANVQAGGDSQLRCTNMGRRTEGKADPCGKLTGKRRPVLSPVRFVVACEKGHIMDFPWNAWAHSYAGGPCGKEEGNLYLYSTPAAGLAGVVVKCTACDAKRSMAGAFQEGALGRIYGAGCPGERPWLGTNAAQPGCDKVPQTVQRGASNTYFAKVVSSILIPPFSALIQQTLDRPDIWREVSVLVDGKLNEPFLRVKAENLGFDPTLFIEAVRDRMRADTAGEGELSEEVSEEEYRLAEYKAYLGPRPPKQERHDFDTKAVPISEYEPWFGKLFSDVILVPKLRETRVLTGFSRIVPPETLDGAAAELSIGRKRWLPGFSVRGEGIFLRFRQEALNEWLASGAAAQRTKPLEERLSARGSSSSSQKFFPDALFVLIHTTAHLLIRQLAFECGYDSSSMRERLYVSSEKGTEMFGLLIYTASGDAEGTMGGLVRQGGPGRLDQTLRASMTNAAICSSDPLCIESKGQGLYSLNLASCHACGLLPETSCETGNVLLDRGLAIGTPDDLALGYFRELAQML